jgi:ethanolamine ammonia-lyase small subunit
LKNTFFEVKRKAKREQNVKNTSNHESNSSKEIANRTEGEQINIFEKNQEKRKKELYLSLTARICVRSAGPDKRVCA